MNNEVREHEKSLGRSKKALPYLNFDIQHLVFDVRYLIFDI